MSAMVMKTVVKVFQGSTTMIERDMESWFDAFVETCVTDGLGGWQYTVSPAVSTLGILTVVLTAHVDRQRYTERFEAWLGTVD
jgi:hypothetical protein